MLFIIIQSN